MCVCVCGDAGIDGCWRTRGGSFFEMEIGGGDTHLGVFQTFVARNEEVGVRGPQSEVSVGCLEVKSVGEE